MNKKEIENKSFEEIANQMVLYKIRESWFQIVKFFDKIAGEYDMSLSMAFVLIALNEKEGTPVTKIAPRIGMEPNSLSRILKKLKERSLIIKNADKNDKRMVQIQLTKEGEKLRLIALKVVFKFENILIENIDKNELESFFKIVNLVPKAVTEFD
jgi:DNA-binding MarR family transcriptional regulator